MSLYEFPSRMDLRHLRYFVAVAEAENFHRAAARLNIVQSALSRRILELERQLCVTLFERSAKGVALTAPGRALLGHARRIGEEAAAAKSHLKLLAAGRTGTLNIGLNRIAPQLATVPASLARFRRAYPDVTLNLLPMTSEQQAAALRAGEIDLGFLTKRPEHLDDFKHLPVFKDFFILALPEGHRLAAPDVAIHMADLAGESFVMFARETGAASHDALTSAFAARDIRLDIVQEGHSEDAQLGLAAAGLGLTFTFSSITTRYHRAGLVFKPVADLDVDIDTDLVWRQSDSSPLARMFVETVAAVLG